MQPSTPQSAASSTTDSPRSPPSRTRPISTPVTAALSAPYTHALIEHSVLHHLIQSHAAHLVQLLPPPSTRSALHSTLKDALLDVQDCRSTLHTLRHTLSPALTRGSAAVSDAVASLEAAQRGPPAVGRKVEAAGGEGGRGAA